MSLSLVVGFTFLSYVETSVACYLWVFEITRNCPANYLQNERTQVKNKYLKFFFKSSEHNLHLSFMLATYLKYFFVLYILL